MEKPRFDIFLGGPMGLEGLDDAGAPLSMHFDLLAKAVTKIADDLNDREDINLIIEVHRPDLGRAGKITKRVFRMMNFSELGILDLTGNRPSVMYELTFLHTLGVPVIPVMLDSQKVNEGIPFYLNQDYIAEVSEFSEEHLYEALYPLVKDVVLPEGINTDPDSNPISEFYGIPLIEASATAGLATGYFYNFLRHNIGKKDTVFNADRSLKKFVILKPNTIEEVEDMKEIFADRVREIGLEMDYIKNVDGKIVSHPHSIRGEMLVFRVGNYVVDTPAPLNAQTISPRYKILRNQMISIYGINRDAILQRIQKLDQNMIQGFVENIERLAETETSTDPNRLMFATPDEMIDILRKEKEESKK